MVAVAPTRLPAWLLMCTWTVLLLCSGIWETLCAHTTYDLKRSTPDCVQIKGAHVNESCAPLLPGCASPNSVQTFSPRWLASLAGDGGPLLMWVPLSVAMQQESPHEHHDVMTWTVAWYLALVGLVRHAHLLLPLDWDPSGHVFVYGAQIVPFLVACPPKTATALLSGTWSTVLFFLSATTASFFHTLMETAAGWLLVLPLWRQLVYVLDRPRLTACFGCDLAVSVVAVKYSLPAWLAATTVGVAVPAYTGSLTSALPNLASQLAYDLLLWGWLAFLLFKTVAPARSTKTKVSTLGGSSKRL